MQRLALSCWENHWKAFKNLRGACARSKVYLELCDNSIEAAPRWALSDKLVMVPMYQLVKDMIDEKVAQPFEREPLRVSRRFDKDRPSLTAADLTL